MDSSRFEKKTKEETNDSAELRNVNQGKQISKAKLDKRIGDLTAKAVPDEKLFKKLAILKCTTKSKSPVLPEKELRVELHRIDFNTNNINDKSSISHC